MSSMWGNAAAHRALYGTFAFTLLEATRYEGQAEEIAKLRTWNESEISILKERIKRVARNIMKQRRKDWRDKTFQALCSIADSEVEKFIEKARERKQK